MKEEMKFVDENDTWELVDLSCRKHPIGLNWVFKLKRNKFGSIIKYKAHFIAKGYIQRPGIDYDNTFAHVAQLKSVCMLLALAGHNIWLMHHMHAMSMFLNGVLHEEVYVS
jgi:hypothetical protein